MRRQAGGTVHRSAYSYTGWHEHSESSNSITRTSRFHGKRSLAGLYEAIRAINVLRKCAMSLYKFTLSLSLSVNEMMINLRYVDNEN